MENAPLLLQYVTKNVSKFSNFVELAPQKKKENCHSSSKDDTYKNGQIVSVTNF